MLVSLPADIYARRMQLALNQFAQAPSVSRNVINPVLALRILDRKKCDEVLQLLRADDVLWITQPIEDLPAGKEA